MKIVLGHGLDNQITVAFPRTRVLVSRKVHMAGIFNRLRVPVGIRLVQRLFVMLINIQQRVELGGQERVENVSELQQGAVSFRHHIKTNLAPRRPHLAVWRRKKAFDT